jgi:predicted transporter
VELKTLFLGMFISMAAFSVKAGMGWAYLCAECPPRRKIAASAMVLSIYGALFAGVSLLVARVNILAHYEIFRPLWQGGVTLHWLAAIFIFAWGLILLRSNQPKDCHGGGKTSRAWLALVVPCPVCLSVVLVSASCLALYFPDDATIAITCLFVAFVTLAGTTCLVMRLCGSLKSGDSEPAERTLAQTMLLIAAYFIVSALVMPQFAEISKIYRLAVYSAETRTSDRMTGLLVAGVLSLLLAFGFLCSRKKLKNR